LFSLPSAAFAPRFSSFFPSSVRLNHPSGERSLEESFSRPWLSFLPKFFPRKPFLPPPPDYLTAWQFSEMLKAPAPVFQASPLCQIPGCLRGSLPRSIPVVCWVLRDKPLPMRRLVDFLFGICFDQFPRRKGPSLSYSVFHPCLVSRFFPDMFLRMLLGFPPIPVYVDSTR